MEELRSRRTPQGLQLQHNGGPIGGMCRLRMTISLDLVERSNKESPGPINNMQEVPGSTLITGTEQEVPCNPSPERQVIRDWVHRSPPPPPKWAGWAETPYPPPQDLPLPQVNYPSGTSLVGNLTSASKSGSEVIVLTQYECGEYFRLNGTSLRGKAAELETSAGQPALLYSASRKSGRASTTMTKPWQAGTGQDKEDHCTSSSLSNNTMR
jgi:hypothetical protein